MFDAINFKKLMDEDPAFKQFVQDILLEIFLLDPNTKDFLSSVHGFYNIGMTKEQVGQWIRNMKASS